MLHFLTALVLSATAVGNNWPAFLGADAPTKDATALPLTWSPTENIAWQQPIDGHGQSSPVVWGDRVFVTSTEGPKKDFFHTLCFDVQTGQQVWKSTIANSAPVENSYYVSRAAPTPVVDAERIVAFFESGDCVAYDHAGQLLWQLDLGKDEGPFKAEFGLAASLCQTDEKVFVLLEHEGPSCLLALDKQTGQRAWKADRKSRISWASPAIVNVDGEPQVVVSSSGTVDGYDVESGNLIWTFDDIGGNTATTPIDVGEGRFLIAASPGRNGEHAGSAADSNGMMQVTRDRNAWSVKRLWIADGAKPSWASPIVHQGLAYWVNRAGVVHCFDATTGAEVFANRTEQSCWATPVGVGDRVYFFGKDGTVTVLAAGKEFNVLAENVCWNDESLPREKQLSTADSPQRQRGAAMFSKPTLYGAAITGDAIIIRVGHALICVR